MSAGFYDLSGFPVQRATSTPVSGSGDYARQAASEQAKYARQLAALKAPQTPDQYAVSLMQPVAQNYAKMYSDAGFNLGPDQAFYTQNALRNDLLRGAPDEAYAAVGGMANYDAWKQYSNTGFGAAQNEFGQKTDLLKRQASGASAAAEEAARLREQNRVVQQDAYSRQFGGGATGGLLSNWNGLAGGSSTSTVQPGSPPPTTESAWSGGMMGSGAFPSFAPPATASPVWGAPTTSSSPTAPAATPVSNLGMGGWRGPFSTQNPWSLS